MAAPSPARKKTSYAQSDVMYNRTDVASRAKMRFKERSARKLLEKSPVKTESRITPQEREMATMKQAEVKCPPQVDEDAAPVDFRAAREAL
ncbi:MAG: hypothetical protein SGARI_004979, partial [Bacillariaceae sp.]